MTAFLYSPCGQLPVPETRSAAQPSQAPDRAEAAPDATDQGRAAGLDPSFGPSGTGHMQGVTHGGVSPRLLPKFAVVDAARHGNSSGEILP